MTNATKTRIAAIAAATLLLGSGSAFAQQGTTLAGPAQGQKADGSASTVPSAESGAGRGGTSTGTTATGTMSGGSTATGGNAGGPAGRN